MRRSWVNKYSNIIKVIVIVIMENLNFKKLFFVNVWCITAIGRSVVVTTTYHLSNHNVDQILHHDLFAFYVFFLYLAMPSMTVRPQE